MLRTLVAGTAALACLTLAGCGDEAEPDAAPSAPPLTKAQLIAKGDAICRAGNARLEKADARVLAQWGGDPTAAQARSYVVKTMVPELRRQVRELRALVPPDANAPAYDLMLDELGAVLDRAEKAPLETVAEKRPFAKANRIAKKLGFKVCSKG